MCGDSAAANVRGQIPQPWLGCVKSPDGSFEVFHPSYGGGVKGPERSATDTATGVEIAGCRRPRLPGIMTGRPQARERERAGICY